MNKLKALLMSAGLGAGAMYFFDPTRGRRRRAMVQSQINRRLNRVDDALDSAVNDLRNRTRGLLAETMARLDDPSSPDSVVVERVRANLGRLVRRPRDVQVSSQGGRVVLSGTVMSAEAERLLKRLAGIRGVKEIDNRLSILPDDDEELAGLADLERRASSWTPSMRLLSGVGGGALALYGGLRRGLVGTLLTTAGLGLMARGVANLDLRSLFGLNEHRRAISIDKSITINSDIQTLYHFWENFENLPRFMEHVRAVKDLGNGRTHWVVDGPAGSQVEWNAIVTRQLPNEEISWESVAGEPVKTAGSVRFVPLPGGATRLDVQMGYTPPAGLAGHAVASLLGSNPKQQMDEDLARLKTLFEQGKTTVEGHTVTGGDLAGATGG